jgi:hypothetical protein
MKAKNGKTMPAPYGRALLNIRDMKTSFMRKDLKVQHPVCWDNFLQQWNIIYIRQ